MFESQTSFIPIQLINNNILTRCAGCWEKGAVGGVRGEDIFGFSIEDEEDK